MKELFTIIRFDGSYDEVPVTKLNDEELEYYSTLDSIFNDVMIVEIRNEIKRRNRNNKLEQLGIK